MSISFATKRRKKKEHQEYPQLSLGETLCLGALVAFPYTRRHKDTKLHQVQSAPGYTLRQAQCKLSTSSVQAFDLTGVFCFINQIRAQGHVERSRDVRDELSSNTFCHTTQFYIFVIPKIQSMKLPSLNHVLNHTGKTIARFPFETLCAVVATVCGHFGIEESGDENVLAKIAMCAALGLVVFLSSSLFFETSQRWTSKRFLVQPVLLLLLCGFYFTFSDTPKEIELLRFAVLNISFHLAVSFAGFINKGVDINGFWEFNKRLFVRILTAGLYSAALFAGLSLAIVALDKLFELDINGKIYPHLFLTIAAIFNTLFFLAGIPKPQSETLETDYPKGLKAFTQFVLIPLVSLYLIILIAYETKIVLTFSLPYGWVSILILVYAIFGILSFLLIYPISHLEGNVWMKTFYKWFYYFLIPLLGLLYWAILYRISHYGFTPERYYVFVLALWLTFIVVYFLIRNTQNLKLIPLSLCLTGLLTLYGPQSAQYVSKISQLSRYQNYLHQNETERLSKEDQKELSSVVDYLLDNHGSEFLIAESNHQLDTITTMGIGSYNRKVMAALGLEYTAYNRYGSKLDDQFNIWSSFTNMHQVTGYDLVLELPVHEKMNCDSCLLVNNTYYPVSAKREGGLLILNIHNDKITVDVNAFANQLKPVSGSDYNRNDLTQIVETERYKIKLIYTNLNGFIKKGVYDINSFSGIICIGVKPQ